MTPRKSSQATSYDRTSLVKGILIGAGIALTIILFFITGAESKPEWPELWKVRPLIVTPLAGAFGGGLFYISRFLMHREGLNSYAATTLSLIGFLIVLWVGIILGLDGTMWD